MAAGLPSARLRALIMALGTPSFGRELMLAAADLLNVRHLALVAFDDRLIPHVAGSESVGGTAVAQAAGKIYEQSFFYRHDPNLQMLGSEAGSDAPLLLRLRAREIQDESYRKSIYERFGLTDRLSILDHSSGHWLAVNLYRDGAHGEFDRADLRAAHAASGTLAALVAKHFALLPPAPWQTARRPSVEVLESLVRSLDAKLTTRQIQVCARALLGMTNVAVGLDLGIQVPTVATLRKRAYSVLGISSLNELFALCLAQATPPV